MSRPILTSFMRSRTTKPPPQIKMSPTRQEQLFQLLFFGGQEGQKRDAFYQSKADTAPPMLPRSAPRGIEREDRGPGQVGLGYRAVSAVGVTEDVLVRFIVGYDILVDCWERPLYSKYAFLGALRSAAQMVPYEVSIGLILIVRLVSAFGSAKAIARMFP